MAGRGAETWKQGHVGAYETVDKARRSAAGKRRGNRGATWVRNTESLTDQRSANGSGP